MWSSQLHRSLAAKNAAQDDNTNPVLARDVDDCRSEWPLARQCLAQHRGITGERKPGLKINYAILYQLGDFAIEVLHPFGGPSLYRIEQAAIVTIPFFDALAGASISFENLESGNPSASISLREQALADDVTERFREAIADRLLLGWPEGGDDTFHGFGGI